MKTLHWIILCLFIICASLALALAILYRSSRKTIDPKEKNKINYRIKIVWIVWGLLVVVGILILFGLYWKFYNTSKTIDEYIARSKQNIEKPDFPLTLEFFMQIRKNVVETMKHYNNTSQVYQKLENHMIFIDQKIRDYKNNINWTSNFLDINNFTSSQPQTSKKPFFDTCYSVIKNEDTGSFEALPELDTQLYNARDSEDEHKFLKYSTLKETLENLSIDDPDISSLKICKLKEGEWIYGHKIHGWNTINFFFK